MPNWCLNTLTTNKPLSYQPGDYLFKEPDVKSLDWNTNNWGTKWNPEVDKVEGNTIYFESAWCPPIPGIVDYLSKENPDVLFIIEYDEPGNRFQGIVIIKDGVILEDYERYDDDYIEKEAC